MTGFYDGYTVGYNHKTARLDDNQVLAVRGVSSMRCLLLLLLAAQAADSLRIQPSARKPLRAQRSPTNPVELDPDLVKEAAAAVAPSSSATTGEPDDELPPAAASTAAAEQDKMLQQASLAAATAAGKASAAVGAVATQAAAQAVVALSGGNVTAEEAVDVAVDGAATAAKTVVGATVALNVLASAAKAAATFCAVAAVGPSVKLLTLGGAVALGAENETEAFLKELGASYQEHYQRNLLEAKAGKEKSARNKWLSKVEEAQASNAKALAHAAAVEKQKAAAVRVAELRAWAADVRGETAELEGTLLVQRNLLDGTAERMAMAAHRSITRLRELAAAASEELSEDSDLDAEVDTALLSARAAQASSAQAVAAALKAKAAFLAKRAALRQTVDAARAAHRSEGEALAAAREVTEVMAAAAAKFVSSTGAKKWRWRPLRRLRGLPPPSEEEIPVVVVDDNDNDGYAAASQQPPPMQIADPLVISRARRVARGLKSPARRAARTARVVWGGVRGRSSSETPH